MSTDLYADEPLAYYAGVLAADFLLVLSNPLHLMYSKVNEFLNRGPEWNVTRLPSYWVDKVLLNPPTDDDGHHQEAEGSLKGFAHPLLASQSVIEKETANKPVGYGDISQVLHI